MATKKISPNKTYSLVPNRRAIEIEPPLGKILFFLLTEPVHNKSTLGNKNPIMIWQGISDKVGQSLIVILFCAFCNIQVFVYMFLILGPHSRRKFVLTLTLLWVTIITQIHQAQPAVGNSSRLLNPKKNSNKWTCYNKWTCIQNRLPF